MLLDRNKRIYERHQKGESYAAIARELGISRESVKTCARKVEDRIRRGIPDWLPIRVANALSAADLTWETARDLPLEQLMKLKNMGVRSAKLVKSQNQNDWEGN